MISVFNLKIFMFLKNNEISGRVFNTLSQDDFRDLEVIIYNTLNNIDLTKKLQYHQYTFYLELHLLTIFPIWSWLVFFHYNIDVE